MKNFLKQKAYKKGILDKPFCVFDIETFGKNAGQQAGRFAVGVVYWKRGKQEISKTFNNCEDMLKYLLTKNLCYAWNLKFDYTFLRMYMNGIEKQTVSRTENGKTYTIPRVREHMANNNTRMLYVQICHNQSRQRAPTLLVDCMNFYRNSLEKEIELNSVPFPKVPVDFDNAAPNSKELKVLTRHCIEDCRATHYLMQLWHKLVKEDLGVKMKITIAATALEFFKVKCMTIPYIQPLTESDEAFIRQGYYGGRTEVFARTSDKDITAYDVNSLYPHMYRLPLPYMYPFHSQLKPEEIATLERHGFIKCTVEVPYHQHPPLPYRNSHRIIYPCGVFSGVWAVCLLQNSIKNYGVKILKVEDALLWTKSEALLEPFRAYTEDFKLNCNGNGGKKLLIKSLRNSLYGKFGEKNERKEVHYEKFTMNDWLDDKVDIYERGADDPMPYWTKTVQVSRTYHLPQISAYITSYAHIEMDKWLRTCHNLGLNVVYMDTDSFFVEGELPEEYLGNKDGELKIMRKGSYIGLASKVYYLGNDVKAKGMKDHHLTKADFEKALHGELDAIQSTWVRPSFDQKNKSVSFVPVRKVRNTPDEGRIHTDNYHSEPIKIGGK